jgi:hypothetical protein
MLFVFLLLLLLWLVFPSFSDPVIMSWTGTGQNKEVEEMFIPTSAQVLTQKYKGKYMTPPKVHNLSD